MATIITIAAVAAAVVAAVIKGLGDNDKLNADKSNFKIEADSLVF